MANGLPYFKFVSTEWLTGNIVYESLELQGLFINICAVYWKNGGKLSISEIEQRYKKKALIAKLTDRFFSVNDGFISIEFLDEQLSEREYIAKTNSENGKKGGRPAKLENKPTANRPLTDRKAKKSHIEEELEEEKEKELELESDKEREEEANSGFSSGTPTQDEVEKEFLISVKSQKEKNTKKPGRAAGKPVSLEDWGDRARFDAELPDWPDDKRDRYWLAVQNSSNKGNKYKDWILAVKGWDRKDEAKSINGQSKPPKETPTQTDDITRVIDEFNALTGSEYDAANEEIRGYIAGRLLDGCQIQDMLDVIALKAVQWGSGESRKYLKFHILFKPEKYPGYCQEVKDAKAGKIKVINPNESAYDRIQRKIDAALGRTQSA